MLNVNHAIQLLSNSAREALTRPEFRITVPPEFIQSPTKTSIIGSLLVGGSSAGDTPKASPALLRFREDIMAPLTVQAAAALEEFRKLLAGSQVRHAILNLTPEVLPRGSIVVMDNRRWLHARNHVNDPERHLRRVRWDGVEFSTGSV